MRVDFHSHILPAIDDGAKDVNESVSLLKRLADDKVDKVVLTSHFYRQN
ncbi:MAG: CpsB/CapC family capsule biosynthesis tyrosine phosphatase, partial [Huintestinicola sp.]